MRILHLCLSCFYIDNYNYQENVLPRLHQQDGHEVLVIASTETFINNMDLGYIEPSEYIGNDGIHVKRIPYYPILNSFITTKVRKYIGLTQAIENFEPDVIFSHDLSFYSILEVIKYIKKNPNVRFFADTHTAKYNSGLSWVSMNLLHKIFYKYLIHKALPYLEKYFYIGENEMIFSRDIYKVPEKIMEFFPLGGIIPNNDIYDKQRTLVRKQLDISEDELMVVHSGKMNNDKKTIELLSAFTSVKSLKAKMIIIGSVSEDIKESFYRLISLDDRILYLGWKESDQLLQYLCGCDLYCQPGSVSATLQNAVCSFAPVMTYPHLIYKKIDMDNFVWVENESDIKKTFERISNKEIELSVLKDRTKECARRYLDYKKLAQRIY